jgi:hypothetical protein
MAKGVQIIIRLESTLLPNTIYTLGIERDTKKVFLVAEHPPDPPVRVWSEQVKG